MYAFGATTGNLLWASHAGTYVYTAPAVWDKTVFVGTYDGKFFALDAGHGRRRAGRATMPRSIHGAPTVMAGLVYFATCGSCGHDGRRYAKSGPRGTVALNARTGKLVWTFPDGQYSPVVADSSGSTSRAGRASTGSTASSRAESEACSARASTQPRARDPGQRPERGTTSGRRGR